ncbi:hypothetical protein EW145_g4270 [Phellinidium pouzarii]|uniref:AAA-ATPase-like domain-containing protein n=1 Tax=Phellinidium pouzarii TaxID=167371 RepID=A0A4S4L5K4_9AGAM|nr:hypothetical protein EW145_g4270 [Phellinidium pouzarii]
MMTPSTNKEEFNPETAYLNLSRILHDCTDRKVLVLVDEYDSPLSSAIDQEMYSYAKIFLRQVFSMLLRIFPLAYDQCLYGDTCLFNEEEVKKIFDHMLMFNPKDTHFSLEQVKQWYEGYDSHVFGIPNFEVRKAFAFWIARQSSSLSSDLKINESASSVVNAAVNGPTAKFRSVFQKCVEKEHISAIPYGFSTSEC